jgi:hypothetical protein
MLSDQMGSKLLVLCALALLTMVSGVATAKSAKQYVLKHPKHERCRRHYVRKVEKVKRREHGHTVKVRETVCVYVAPKPVGETTPKTTPAPASTPARTVKLHAHLDSNFIQDPSNPFEITYSYSASASLQTAEAEAPEPNLPEGVLNLYTDGLLACSINVGGNVTGGECPTHATMGEHTIIVTYTSGQTSATETSVETIKPFPVASTTTTLRLTLIGCEEEAVVRGKGPYGKGIDAIEHRCSYTAEVAATGEGQHVALALGGTPELIEVVGEPSAPAPLVYLSFTSNPGRCTITVGYWQAVDWSPGWSVTGSAGCPSSEAGARELYDDVYPPQTEWRVGAHGEGNPGFGEGGGGWLASESAPQILSG